MDYLDVDMRLPPRKRLLAGLRREKSFAYALPPVPFISGDLGAHIHQVINSPTSTPEDIVEVSKSVAAAAVEIAATAKDIAMEKAAASAKACAAAKNALDFLDSMTGDRRPKRDHSGHNKLRKEVPIKLFYKTQRPATDEELARKLHRAMNSSPRISNSKQKKVSSSSVEIAIDDGALNSRNVFTHDGENYNMINGTLDNMEEKSMVCSEVSTFDEEDEKEELCTKKSKKNLHKPREVSGCRKSKTKRKKLSLSQCDVSDQKIPANDASAIVELTSIWKCKKLKMTRCSSDSKILPALC